MSCFREEEDSTPRRRGARGARRGEKKKIKVENRK
jgi:hypothetical protein